MARTRLPSGGRARGTRGVGGCEAAVRVPGAWRGQVLGTLSRPADLMRWPGALATCAETCLNLGVKKIVVARSAVSAVPRFLGICRGLEGGSIGSARAPDLDGRRAVGEARPSQCPVGGDPAADIPSHLVGGAERSATLGRRLVRPPGAESAARPRPFQRALAARPPGTALPWASLGWKPA